MLQEINLENLPVGSLTTLKNLKRGFFGILKPLSSLKDQRKLYIPFFQQLLWDVFLLISSTKFANPADVAGIQVTVLCNLPASS